MITSKLSQNFSFKPLKNNIDKIINEAKDEIGKSYAFHIKHVLDKGILESRYPLTKKRIRNRKQGIWFPDSKQSPKYIPKTQNMTKPLVQTENLLNSIEAKKDGIYMADYGKLHNDGSGGMKKRPFIDIALMTIKATKPIDKIGRKLFFKAAKLLKKVRVTEL